MVVHRKRGRLRDLLASALMRTAEAAWQTSPGCPVLDQIIDHWFCEADDGTSILQFVQELVRNLLEFSKKCRADQV